MIRAVHLVYRLIPRNSRVQSKSNLDDGSDLPSDRHLPTSAVLRNLWIASTTYAQSRRSIRSRPRSSAYPQLPTYPRSDRCRNINLLRNTWYVHASQAISGLADTFGRL